MLKNITMVIVLSGALLLTAGCSGGGKFKAGTYTGSGEGKNGPIKVEVSVDKSKIKSIKVLEHNETAGLSDPILKKIPETIIKEQSTEVSAISGATVTSNAIKAAVNDALKGAQK